MRRLSPLACVPAALALLGFGSPQARAQSVDLNKPALRYTFEDGPANGNTTFTDVSGNGYNGTFTGNGDLTLGFSTDAKQGTYAGSTDGDAGRFAQVASAKAFDFTSQFTVFTFLKMVDRGGQIQSIIGNAGGFPEDGFKLFANSYNTDDHTINFEYEGIKVSTASTNLLDGNYHAVAFSVDQTNKLLKVYLDGVVLVNNAALTTPFPTANPTINLGTDGFFTSTSKFDDFRVYTGILTDAQVLTLSGLSSAPPAPTNLIGSPRNAAAFLKWTAAPGATSYIVKRSATGAAGTFTTIGTAAGTSYTDSGLANGVAYYYVVDAHNVIGDSPDSNKVSVTPSAASALLVRYTFEDGPANGNSNITDVTGNGYTGAFAGGPNLSLGFTTDSKQGVYAGSTDPTPGVTRYIAVSPTLPDLTNQFSIFTFIKMAPGSNIQTVVANAGPGSASGFKLYVNHYGTSDGAIVFENRDGGAGVGDIASPVNAFPADNAYHSLALVADEAAGTATIYLDGAVVASGTTITNSATNGQINLGQFVGGAFLSASEFDDFRIYQGLLTGPQIAALSGAAKPSAPTNLAGVGGNGFATLTWTGVSGAAYNVKRSLTSGGPYTTVATNVATTTYTDSGLTNGVTYYYVVTAVNTAGESGNSNQAAVTPIDTTKLVLRYTFEDGPANGNILFTDVTGNGYNGTFTGNGDLTLGFSTDAAQGTYAGSTDGDAGRFAQVASAKAFDFTSQFTVFTFLKMVDRGNQIQSIIGNAGGYPEDGFKFFINSYNSDDHKIFFEYEGQQIVTNPTNLLDGNYHAVAFSVDQTNKLVKIYLDGQVIKTAALNVAFPTANPTINLGTDGFFNSTSKFDDFRVYTGILTDGQVTALSTVGATVTGSIALEGVANLAAVSPASPLGAFQVSLRQNGLEVKKANVTLTTTAGSNVGTFTVTGVAAGTYGLWIKGSKNLAVLTSGVVVSANGGSVGTTANPITLPAADSNNDNSVDSSDFTALIGAFNSDAAVAGSGYDPTADFNFDGFVDSSDFTLLIGQFNNVGPN